MKMLFSDERTKAVTRKKTKKKKKENVPEGQHKTSESVYFLTRLLIDEYYLTYSINLQTCSRRETLSRN